jgi:hypothetical protein
MLNTAAGCGERVPYIVEANYLPPKEGEEGYNAEVSEAFENYGVKDYVIIERGGVYFAIFGIYAAISSKYRKNKESHQSYTRQFKGK